MSENRISKFFNDENKENLDAIREKFINGNFQDVCITSCKVVEAVLGTLGVPNQRIHDVYGDYISEHIALAHALAKEQRLQFNDDPLTVMEIMYTAIVNYVLRREQAR